MGYVTDGVELVGAEAMEVVFGEATVAEKVSEDEGQDGVGGWHTLRDADLPQMRVPHPSLFSGEGWAATNFSSPEIRRKYGKYGDMIPIPRLSDSPIHPPLQAGRAVMLSRPIRQGRGANGALSDLPLLCELFPQRTVSGVASPPASAPRLWGNTGT